MRTIDCWIPLTELSKMFGLSEESIKRMIETHGFPLRRVTPYATPGMLESELVRWLKAQPRTGTAVRKQPGHYRKGIKPRLSSN